MHSNFSAHEHVLETFGKLKIYLLLTLENMFLLPLWNLKEHNLLKNRQAFSQSIGEIFLTYFFSNMHVKRNLRTRLLVTKRTEAMPWSNQKLVRESQNSAQKVLSISLKLQTTRVICDGQFCFSKDFC